MPDGQDEPLASVVKAVTERSHIDGKLQAIERYRETIGRKRVAYSVIVWLVDPGEQPYELEEREISADKEEAPGARSGSNIAPALPRMTYGVYEDQGEADSVLQEIGDLLRENRPLKIDSKAHRVFLVPAHRVHYVVCEEVQRPMDSS